MCYLGKFLNYTRMLLALYLTAFHAFVIDFIQHATYYFVFILQFVLLTLGLEIINTTASIPPCVALHLIFFIYINFLRSSPGVKRPMHFRR